MFYQAQGETRFRELAAKVTNPRTAAQMAQRVRWANLVNFYRANRNWMQRAFENKPQNNTDYNRFMSLNGGTSDIYLTKQEANAGACVVNNYKVTDGTLNAIEITVNGSNWLTNIWTGDLAAISAATTVGQFAQALLSSNAGLRMGDQLSFIRLSQQVSGSTSYPFVIVRAYEVLLNPSSSELLSDYLPLDYFAIVSVNGTNTLQVVNSGNAGGFVLVLSRTEGGIIRVSPQEVVVANNTALIARYSSAAQQQLAADSYGEGTEVFLSSASANEINPWGIDNSILSLRADGTNYTPNSYVGKFEDLDNVVAALNFSNPVAAASATIDLVFKSGSSTITRSVSSTSVEDAAVNFDFPGSTPEVDDYILTSLSCSVDGNTYTIQFSDDAEDENELG